MPYVLRRLMMFVLNQAMGAIVFLGISWLVGLAFPAAQRIVFAVLVGVWVFLGVLYELHRARARQPEPNDWP
ncbi:MAG: hypothetical protein ACHP84_13725 [Caulobacterales bacterium]